MKKELVYVNGFPKSGNTWMTRLFAECLNSPAGSGFKNASDETEAATEGQERAGDYKVVKAHFIYEAFPTEHLDKKIIVPIRDVRDVLVSLFYHEYNTLSNLPSIIGKLAVKYKLFHFFYAWNKLNEIDVNLELSKNIVHHTKKFFYRKKFEMKINRVSKLWSNIKVNENSYMETNWSSFNKTWFEKSKSSKQIAFVKYEDLLESPFETIIETFSKLGITDYDESQVRQAIDNQSFKTKKKKYENNEIESFRGSKYNAIFMRKGESGDYKNYFQPSLEKSILETHYEVLENFNYIDNI